MQKSINASAQSQSTQPFLAALKSMAVPGLGQWHNGEVNKAAWWFLAFAFVSAPAVALVALYLPPAWTAPALAAGALLGIGLWLGSVVDAWRVARLAAVQDASALVADESSAQRTPLWRMSGKRAVIPS